jgi:hypothetical protein
MDRQFFKACGDGPRFLEPTDTALNDVATPVLLRIEGRRSSSPVPDLVKPLRNDGTDSMSPQPLPDATMTVRSIRCHLLRSPPAAWPVDTHGIKDWFNVQRLAGLSGAELDCQRQPCAIGDQMQFRAPAAAATAQRVIGGFVGGPVFFPRRTRLCALARWSHRYTRATTQSAP